MRKMFNRGITLLETIVAMAVIAVLSILAISVIEVGYKQTNESLVYSEARQIANNAYEAFIFSTDYSSFEIAMNKSNSSYVSCSKEESLEKYTICYEVKKVTLTVVLEYDDTNASISLICNDSDNSSLFSYSYEKLIESEVTIDE